MIEFFDIDSIKAAAKKFSYAPSAFRYGYIANLFKEDVYKKLVETFPLVSEFKLVDKQSGGGRKRFYIGPAYDASKNWGCVCHLRGLPKIWKDVLNESISPEFASLFREATGVNFNSLCAFGFTYGNEGCMQEAHIDGAVRENDPNPIHSTIACLMYFNKEEGGTGGTCVYATDRKTILFQAPSLRNGLFFFEQHPDAWHGFPIMPPGSERRLVSLAYSLEKSPINLKTSITHRFICLPSYKRAIKKLIK